MCISRRLLLVAVTVTVLFVVSTLFSLLGAGAGIAAQGASEPEPGGPAITIVPVVSPRQPKPIPHTDVLAPEIVQSHLQSAALSPQSQAANVAADSQGVSGKPGVFQAESEIGSGITLHEFGIICNNFNRNALWEGEIWTKYFAGWGAFAADDGYFQAKNVTFERERVVGPGENYAFSQASLKIASNQPYDAGVMSPQLRVRPGQTVHVRVAYLIYNHDTPGRNTDYASMGIIPELGQPAVHVQGYQRGQWAILEQEVTATGNRFVVMLQGHSPDAINSNIYFDNVEITVNGRPLRNCR